MYATLQNVWMGQRLVFLCCDTRLNRAQAILHLQSVHTLTAADAFLAVTRHRDSAMARLPQETIRGNPEVL